MTEPQVWALFGVPLAVMVVGCAIVLRTLGSSVGEFRRDMRACIAAINSRLDPEADSLRPEMTAKFDAVDARIDRLDAKIDAADAKVDRLDAKLEVLDRDT